MEYIPVESLDPEVVKKLASKKEMDMTQSDMVTYATAFGQIKITGRLSPKLQEQGVKAIKRLALLWGNGVTEIQSRMIDDLAFHFLSIRTNNMKLAGSKYMRIIEIRNYTMKCGY